MTSPLNHVASYTGLTTLACDETFSIKMRDILIEEHCFSFQSTQPPLRVFCGKNQDRRHQSGDDLARVHGYGIKPQLAYG